MQSKDLRSGLKRLNRSLTNGYRTFKQFWPRGMKTKKRGKLYSQSESTGNGKAPQDLPTESQNSNLDRVFEILDRPKSPLILDPRVIKAAMAVGIALAYALKTWLE